MERNREVPEAALLNEMTAALETVGNAAMPTHIYVLSDHPWRTQAHTPLHGSAEHG